MAGETLSEAEHSIATMENPLLKSVGIITSNPELITPEIVAQLMNCFPLQMMKKFMPSGDSTVSRQQQMLGNQLERMARTSEQLMNSAIASDDPDLKRKALAAGKDLFNLYAKYEDLIDRQSRQATIEKCVKETFAQLGSPEIEKLFLDLLQEKLVRAAKSN